MLKVGTKVKVVFCASYPETPKQCEIMGLVGFVIDHNPTPFNYNRVNIVHFTDYGNGYNCNCSDRELEVMSSRFSKVPMDYKPFMITCKPCKQREMSNKHQFWADKEGEAFKDYFCSRCKEKEER